MIVDANAGVKPQTLAGDARREKIFYLLVERDTLLHLQGEQPGRKIAFHCDVIKEVDRRLVEAYPAPAQFTVSEARALLDSTRKFTVPLLAYFDGAGYTRRRGDKRMMVRIKNAGDEPGLAAYVMFKISN